MPATFESLRLSNEKKIERAKLLPTTTDKLREKQKNKMDAVLTERADLEDLASAQDQRTAYGVEQWHQDFRMLREFYEFPQIPFTGEKLRWYIWKAVPNSRYKRFQEIFSRPEQLSVPPFTVSEKGKIEFDKSIDFNSISLRGCLISPDRLSDDFLQALGLEEASDEPEESTAKFARRQHYEADIKKIFESATPLQEGQHRLLRVDPANEEMKALYPDANGVSEKAVGSILYVREQENGYLARRGEPRPPRKLAVQFFSDVYAAYRKTQHEQHLYVAEINQLVELKESLVAMNQRLDSEGRKDVEEEIKAPLRIDAQQLLARCVEVLETCDNKFKVRAHNLLAEVTNLRDKKNRENFSVVMNKMITAVNEISKRFNDIRPKSGYNQQDQNILQEKIGGEELRLKTYKHMFATTAQKYITKDQPLFSDTELDEGKVRAQVHNIERRLAPINPLQVAQLQPFRFYAERLIAGRAQLHQKLLDRNCDGAQSEAIKLHVVGKFQSVRTCFERAKQYMNEGHISLSRIGDFVGELRKIYDEKQLFPEKSVASYEPFYEMMKQVLSDLERTLHHYAGQNLDAHQREELYERMKKYLEDFDIEAVVKKLDELKEEQLPAPLESHVE